MASCTGLLGQQVYDNGRNFLKFQLKTELETEINETLTLPAITICNRNMFTKYLLNEMDELLLENITNALWKEIFEIGKNRFENGTKNESIFVFPYELILERAIYYEAKEIEILKRFNEQNFTISKWLERIGWQLNTTVTTEGEQKRKYPAIIDCYIGRVPCGLEDFRPVHTREGLCYSFNVNPNITVNQNLAGVENGLRLIIDVDGYDYTNYSLNGFERLSKGVTVAFHDWNEPPDVNMGLAVPTGYNTHIGGLKQRRTLENSYPWSTCSSYTEDLDMPYSKKNCIFNCKSNYTLEICGCRLWFENADIDMNEICGLAMTSACLYYMDVIKNINDFTNGNRTINDNNTRLNYANERYQSCVLECEENCIENLYDFSTTFLSILSKSSEPYLTNLLYTKTGIKYEIFSEVQTIGYVAPPDNK